MTTFTLSDRARKHGRELLKGDAHAHLRGVRIRYVESDASAPAAAGCAQLGRVGRMSDWEMHLTGDGDQEQGDQVKIVLLKETWGGMLEPEARSALDHLFGHLQRDGEKIAVYPGHDVEVNFADLDRTGLWSKGLKRLRERVQQLPLDAEPIVVENDAAAEDTEREDGLSVEMLFIGPALTPRRALVAGIRAPGVRCSDCGSENVHSMTWREVAGGTEYSGYVCRACGSTFILALPEGREDEPVDPRPDPDDNADGHFTGGSSDEQEALRAFWRERVADEQRERELTEGEQPPEAQPDAAERVEQIGRASIDPAYYDRKALLPGHAEHCQIVRPHWASDCPAPLAAPKPRRPHRRTRPLVDTAPAAEA